MANFHVRRVAVLGAGVMGAQIAAHLVNAQVDVVLFDLPARDGPRNGIVLRAIDGLRKLNPAPLGAPDLAARIVPANYDDDLERLRDCDLLIEAIAERMDWKLDLYRRIAPFVALGAIFASNTSGLSSWMLCSRKTRLPRPAMICCSFPRSNAPPAADIAPSSPSSTRAWSRSVCSRPMNHVPAFDSAL